MYQWTKKYPKKTGFYWLNILKTDGTPKKGFPRVVNVEEDDRFEVAGERIPKGTLVAKGYWSSLCPNINKEYRWSSKPITLPK